MMKRTILAAVVPIALLMATGASANAQTKMKTDFWVYSGNKYRRTGAEGAFLGSAGIVRKTFGKAYSYERKETVGRDFLKEHVEVSKVTRVKGSTIKTIEHKGMFKWLTLNIDDTVKYLRQSKLDLIKIELSQGDLKRAINGSKKYRGRLSTISPKGKLRIVTAIWVVVSADEYTKIEARLKGKLQLYGATVQGDDSASSENNWTISPKTIIAYEFAKVDWDKKTGRINGFKVDKPNM